MLAAERQATIINLIQENGSVQVDELAKSLQVSPMTIRRDLLKLEENGQIERCHGGAVAKQEMTYADKQTRYTREKSKIAEICSGLVSSGDTVFLDAGTTTYEIARRICNIQGITIVTNDLEIAQIVKNSSAELIVCGGVVQKSTGSMLGYYATQLLKDFRFDVGFFGAASINEKLEVMTPTVDKAFLKREASSRCGKSYLAVDMSKFERQAMVKINCLSDYTGVVTNRVFTPKEQEIIKREKIQIINL
ncbi:MAG: DeoR/GlpR family DNA-binding transcription regulator [Eubacteriales bacterium]|nr:DeoR/GlpR family DNA-binding transcription regulator [Eubacteriales bacterium]